jgi:hypothetical protein
MPKKIQKVYFLLWPVFLYYNKKYLFVVDKKIKGVIYAYIITVYLLLIFLGAVGLENARPNYYGAAFKDYTLGGLWPAAVIVWCLMKVVVNIPYSDEKNYRLKKILSKSDLPMQYNFWNSFMF